MKLSKPVSAAVAKQVGDELGIDWKRISSQEWRDGLETELEHGSRDPQTNVTDDDALLTGKIAWAHLKEHPQYYTRLRIVEKVETYMTGRV